MPFDIPILIIVILVVFNLMVQNLVNTSVSPYKSRSNHIRKTPFCTTINVLVIVQVKKNIETEKPYACNIYWYLLIYDAKHNTTNWFSPKLLEDRFKRGAGGANFKKDSHRKCGKKIMKSNHVICICVFVSQVLTLYIQNILNVNYEIKSEIIIFILCG